MECSIKSIIRYFKLSIYERFECGNIECKKNYTKNKYDIEISKVFDNAELDK